MTRYAVEPLVSPYTLTFDPIPSSDREFEPTPKNEQRAVGYEGIFGLFTTLALMPILYVLIGRTPQGKGGYFDPAVGFEQIMNNSAVAWSCVAIAISIAFFNL